MASEKRILIVACPRSGTKFIVSAMKRMGLDASHETDLGHGSVVGWRFAASGSCQCNHFRTPCNIHTHFDEVWHAVRHPLNQIASMRKNQSPACQNATVRR